MNKAYLQVYRNKGAAGVDGVTVGELNKYLKEHKEELTFSIIKKYFMYCNGCLNKCASRKKKKKEHLCNG